MFNQLQGNSISTLAPPLRASATTAPKFTASNWRALNKNSLLGTFDLLLPSGMVLCGCQLLQKGESRWVGLPSTRYAKQDGTLSDHKKVIDFNTPQAKARFQEFAKAAIDELLAEGAE
jgi:hypothetical protein